MFMGEEKLHREIKYLNKDYLCSLKEKTFIVHINVYIDVCSFGLKTNLSKDNLRFVLSKMS